MKFITKKNLVYRLQQLFILIAHLLLLLWIYFILSKTGTMVVLDVAFHFLGAATYGSVLILATAWWARCNL